MNKDLQAILNIIQQSEHLTDEEKNALLKSAKSVDKELEIASFKLDRTEKVKRTTAILLEETIEELEQKRKAVEAQNRELEIESALERVRTVAMSMNKPDDMLHVCGTISHQLELLGVKEIRNVQTAIFYEDKHTYMDYEYYAKHDKTFITETTYTGHAIPEAFAEKMLKGNGEFYITHIKSDEIKDWIAYQKTTNVFIDDYLYAASSLNYYWYSLGPVALGISTYVPLTEDETNLFRRFLKVFELSYRRYLDIEKAEAQAHEAKVEASLEKVRAVAMSMNKPGDLLNICETLFQEFSAFGFADLRNAMINIHNDEKKTFVNYDYSDEIGKSTNHLAYNIHPVIEKQIAQVRSSNDAFSETVFAGEDLDDWKKFRKEIGEKDDPRINKTAALHYYFYSIGTGSIGISTFSPVSEENLQLLKRFRNVFNLSYQRYTDLALAEAQAKEARIETALERVRAVAMAMRKPHDLSGIGETLFNQLKALDFNELRNAEIIINNDEKETIRSYYCDYGVSGTIEIDYKANPIIKEWATQLRKSNDAFVEINIPENEMDAWRKYREEIGYMPDPKLNGAKTVYYYSYSIGLGALSISSFKPIAEEQIKILERFRNVFNLSYQRYIDIAKAEAQAREAQIENALEKVRSRSLAMHKSEELREVIKVVFDKLKELEIKLDNKAIALVIFIEGKKDLNFWILGPNESYAGSTTVPYYEHPVISSLWDANAGEKDFISKVFLFAEKNAYWKWAFENTDNKFLPNDTKKMLLDSESYAYSGALAKKSGILVFSAQGETLTEKDGELLKRFANVFDQAYIRFLDLQKAEAQARESQIQLALERVRARTMAMQKSDELKYAATLLFQQAKALGVPAYSCGYNIWEKGEKEFTSWMSTQDGSDINGVPNIPLTEDANFIRYVDSKQNSEPFFVLELRGERMQQHYEYLKTIPAFKAYFDYAVSVGFDLPQTQIHYVANFSQGNLLFITLEPCPEFHDVFKRFAVVFEQTYTRFLDLQKAEAQAREAQIQLALERVRAKTMAMHSSEDVTSATETMFDELKKLGINNIRGGITNIHPEKTMDVFGITNMIDGKTMKGFTLFDMNEHPIWQRLFESWNNKNEVFIDYLAGQEKEDYINVINSHQNYLPQSIVEFPDTHFQSYRFDQGTIWTYSLQPHSETDREIMKRFASGFALTFRRYQDLQKAEAQAREAQIEAALERVRARTMAMFKSDELAETAVVLFKQMFSLGISPNRLYIAIINDNSGDLEFWMTDENGDKLSSRYIVNVNKNISIKKMYEGWSAKKKAITIDMQGKELENWLTYWKEEFHVAFKPGAALQRRVQNIAYFSKGFIAIASPDDQPESTINLLERFASVFNLTYTRFGDLQQAEAQAREAQIEASLERVRSRTMAMHNSRDVGNTIVAMFDELVKLDVQTDRCGILIGDESQYMEVWTAKSNANGEATLIIGKLDMMMHPLLAGANKAWKNKKSVYTYEMIGEDLKDYYRAINNANYYPVEFDTSSLPAKQTHTEFFFPDGAIFAFTPELLSADAIKIFNRFAGVFALTYRRYLDLQKAEAQSREATIEAALEKVRGRAMAMHNSNDLSSTASTVFTELRKLGIKPIRCGVGLLNKESRRAQLYSASSSTDGDTLSLIGWVELSGHEVMENIYDSWVHGDEYYPELNGEQLRSYYELLLAGLSVSVPDWESGEKQFGHFIPFSVGCLYAWSDHHYGDPEIKILKRFASIIDLTFRRYIELQKSEANAKEALKQAALDRVRADIASMRTIADLGRITPLIWNELTVLGIPFVRCGVFIMDEPSQLIHTFLSTPEGKAIAAFHLPYDTPGSFADVVSNWHQKKMYINHWDEKDFISLADTLVQQEAIANREQYMNSIPHEGIHLHFLPFLQGMLYVGNTNRLNDDEIKLIQSVADAFSTAYARYEDFNKLEAAKQQVEKTLVDLKQAQTQLVQSEKMASLGELTAGIAHEIQNPLNFVNNFSEVSNELISEIQEERHKAQGTRDEQMQDEILNDIKQNLEKINHHGKRADAIVKGMLQHSRSSTGAKEPTDINVLTDEYLRLCYHGLRAKDNSFNATIKTDFDKTIDKINIMPQDIGRVILNLLTNAFYAVNEKLKAQSSKQNTDYKPTVSVQTKKLNDKIEIRVTDNGNGIPQNIIDKIFQPFFTTKPTGQGTGLGLSLSYDIIKAHGGELKVETKEGEGSEFIIQLPVV